MQQMSFAQHEQARRVVRADEPDRHRRAVTQRDDFRTLQMCLRHLLLSLSQWALASSRATPYPAQVAGISEVSHQSDDQIHDPPDDQQTDYQLSLRRSEKLLFGDGERPIKDGKPFLHDLL